GRSLDGPWRVVKKTRRNKKENSGRNNSTAAINDPPTNINDNANLSGSRFISLIDDTLELEGEGKDTEENLRDMEKEGEDKNEESQ
ncbi:hypothetical protein A2U01_0060888, partial [Trifolium medium]|nr:hypothetical protein [Trifolium medium]